MGVEMKILIFSVVEILPSLLDKSKTQTIRPAWGRFTYSKENELRKPRFKVGEEVQLMWKQRSKYKWFERDSGEGYIELQKGFIEATTNVPLFNKLLGKVKITEVFKVEINRIEEFFKKKYFIRTPFMVSKEDLAKRDGFKSAAELFRWFDKQYNLSSPKLFYVYRWAFVKAKCS